jgi:uncharacterized repeat protein (TIGR03803 family)
MLSKLVAVVKRTVVGQPAGTPNFLEEDKMNRQSILIVMALLAILTLAGTALAQSVTVLHTFNGNDGADPAQQLLQASDGNLYGTTSSGGPPTTCPDFFGCGTIFKLDAAGRFTALHYFVPTEGAQPSRLLAASDGNFYGTTPSYGIGPSSGCGFSHSCGTVFKMDRSGSLTVLHYFQGGTDGQTPTGGLIQASDGNLYGTTWAGTVYRIDTAGNLTTLHTFNKVRDGAGVNGPLVQGTDGNFYGTASFGGTFDGGTIFKVDAAGNLTVLHHFAFTEGWQPKAGLIQARDGFFYGTTEQGGSAGFIFKIDVAGNYTVLHSFDDYGSDGYRPVTPLIQGADGNFYGTVPLDGLPVWDPNRKGVLFKLDTAGNVSVLQTFTGSNGASPYAAVVQANDGMLYGTTFGGGLNGLGVIFRLDPSQPNPIAAYSFSPNIVFPGNSSTGTVTLSAPAPSGGAAVALSNISPGAVTVPDSVTVPAGKSSVTFTALTSPLVDNAVAKIFASLGGAGISTTLTVTRGTTAVTFSTTKLTFTKTVIGVTSMPKSLKLTNTGTATLNISSIRASGDFAISSNACGATVSVGASCSVSVTFTPTNKGTRTGNLAFNDDAPNTPQIVALVGTGTALKLTPSSLNFWTVIVGQTSASQTVTVTNVSTFSVAFTSFSFGGIAPGDYLITNNTCGASLSGGAVCAVSIAFKPTVKGTRNATLKVADDGGGSPQTAKLTGVGG